MARFLRYLALFMLPLVVLAAAVELYISNLPNEYEFKDKWMTIHADSLETLVIGNSKSYYGVNPKFLSSKAFNLSTISERPDYDCFVLEKYAPICKKLKTIIYPVFYEMFVDPPFEKCEEWPRATYFKRYMDCPYHSWLSRYALEITSPTAVSDKYRSYKADGGMGCDSLGFGLHCQLKNKNMQAWESGEEAVNAAIWHTDNNSKYKDFNYGYVCRFAEYCLDRHYRLIMVAFPCRHLYVQRLDKEQLDDFYKRIYNVKDKYKCEFYDFMDDERFDGDDLFDSNHLTEVGAEKITILLDSIIESKETFHSANLK